MKWVCNLSRSMEHVGFYPARREKPPRLERFSQDVRLDERVEQLFGIVNSLVSPDSVALRTGTGDVW